MKICLIKNIYPPFDRGGAEQVVYQTVQGLLEAGHTVVIITSSPEGESVEKKDNLTIYRFKPKNIYFYTQAHTHNFLSRALWHLLDIFNVGSARTVKRILQQEKPNVVHTHNLMGMGFLTSSVVRKSKIRYVHTVHDVQLVEPSAIILKTEETSWRYTGFPTRLYTWLMLNLIGSPDVVISPSQFLLDFYRSRGFFNKSHTVVMRNPFTFPALTSDSNTKNVHENTTFRFLYMGQIEKHKGVHVLVEAFIALLAAHNIDCELHVVGNGSELEHIKNIAKLCNRIHIYGRLAREALPRIFKQMDVTVVPSLCYENSPTVIFESFSCGVPVLASRVEGIAELIKEGENGVTFLTGDIASLVEKMYWCFVNRTELATMGINSQQIISGLSLPEYVKKLEQLYNNN